MAEDNRTVYQWVKAFKKRYPSTIAWRIKSHCKVVQKHLNKGEIIRYAFTGQKNDKWYNMMNTAVFVLTNKRLIIGVDRVLFGYFLYSITPDMFNDLTVYSGFIYGKVIVDTIKETVTITNVSKSSLDEIETNVTDYMIKEKKKYLRRINNDNSES